MNGAKALFNSCLKQRDASLNQFWDLLLVYSYLLKEIWQGDLEGLCGDGLEAVGVVVVDGRGQDDSDGAILYKSLES